MYRYIKGIIKFIECNFVVLDNHGIGYTIYVPNPYYYKIDEEYTIYIYSHIREDEYSLYGFKSLSELELFLKLIEVKGVGPKMALPMLATGSPEGIYDAINRENILYLKKFPKIGEKVARQIILDLKGKVNSQNIAVVEEDNELVDAMLALGYKPQDIRRVLPNVDKDLSLEEQIKMSLKLLLK